MTTTQTWRALSRNTVGQLNWLIKQGSIATMLKEAIQSISPTQEKEAAFITYHVIIIALVVPLQPADFAMLERCLTEAGIGLLEQLENGEVHQRVTREDHQAA